MRDSSNRPRILIVVAVTMAVKAFLLNYLPALSKDWDDTVVSSEDVSTLANVLPDGVGHVSIDSAKWTGILQVIAIRLMGSIKRWKSSISISENLQSICINDS